MTSVKSIALVTFVTLIASTSLASAFGTVQQVGKPDIQVKDTPVYQPVNPVTPYKPVTIIDVYKPIPIKPTFVKKAKIDPVVLMLACQIKTTQPTTDDFWIVNVGQADLPLGLKVAYSVPSTDDRGAFLLPRTVAPGEKVKVADLLDDAQSGAPCKARIL